jgi:hypothetical protein
MTTEMTPDERSRKIAAYFEKATETSVRKFRKLGHETHFYYWRSKGGWWIWRGSQWEPRQDPEITLRLLSWLLERGIVSIDETQGRIEVACDSKVGATNSISFAVIGKDLADAIASAAEKQIENGGDVK